MNRERVRVGCYKRTERNGGGSFCIKFGIRITKNLPCARYICFQDNYFWKLTIFGLFGFSIPTYWQKIVIALEFNLKLGMRCPIPYQTPFAPVSKHFCLENLAILSAMSVQYCLKMTSQLHFDVRFGISMPKNKSNSLFSCYQKKFKNGPFLVL